MLLFYTHVNLDLPNDIFDTFLSILLPATKQNILAFKQRKDRWLILAGRLLLSKAFEIQGLSLNLDDIARNKLGRPYLPHQEIDFNISHSGNYSLCVLSKQGKVGIDIEKIRNVNIDAFRKYMTDDQWIDIIESDDKLKRFFYYWTLKESVLKAEGSGISGGLLSVENSPDGVYRKGKRWFTKEVLIDSDYICHVASDSPFDNNLRLIQVDLFNLPKISDRTENITKSSRKGW
ncbi:MAG TPA: 4'-phosphopantetheinyl transferase superfamily protein [Nitrospirae bacterium]|nr:4'-phosphopantetheinyl transferase superfamily protein [Nitrospirota bacterium]